MQEEGHHAAISKGRGRPRHLRECRPSPDGAACRLNSGNFERNVIVPVRSARLERLRRRATEYAAAGNAAAASMSLETLLAETPEDDAARLDLALALLHLDRYRDAHAHALAACERNPSDPALALTRLEALRAFGEHGRMRAIGHAVEAFERIEPHALALGAETLTVAGADAAARTWADAAVRADPDDPRLRVNRAMVAVDAGAFDSAQGDLDLACTDTRLVPLAHWQLAMLRPQTREANHVPRLQALLGRPELPAVDRAPLAFALHKELDDLGRHAEAWEALEVGCRAKRSLVHHDPDADDRLLDAIRTRFRSAAPMRETAGPTPIFIVGMHRSGTSLLERILEGHPQVAVGGESQRFTAQLSEATDHHATGVIDRTLIDRADAIDQAALARRYLDAHAWLADGRSHFTEKLPSNAWLLGFLQRALPSARVLHLVRDPMDTCWSNLRELFAGNNVAASYDQIELARHCARHHRLMRHWHETLPGFVLDVPYEGLVRDPESWARRVFEACGLPWVPEALHIERRTGAVRTASAAQVRAPIHTRSLRRWAPYDAQLLPLRQALASLHVAS